MKIVLRFPGGGKLYLEKKPISQENFEDLCTAIIFLGLTFGAVILLALAG